MIVIEKERAKREACFAAASVETNTPLFKYQTLKVACVKVKKRHKPARTMYA